jgi:hypothetical protein
MLGSMKAPCGVSRFLSAILAIVNCAAACIVVFPTYSAGPSFQVRVEDRGRPVVGLRLDLKGDRLTKTAETGEGGFAQFRNIPPGDYVLSANLDAGMPEAANVHVTAQGPSNTTISLAWPRHSPLLLTSLQGILRWPAIQEDPKHPNIKIELLDARTGRSHKTIESNSDGAFDLGKPAPGLHILQVSRIDLAFFKGERVSGNILIEVDPLAAQSELDLDISWTSCGMHYVERKTCPQEELTVSSLSGQVMDAGGAPIGRAKLSLYNQDRVLVEQQISDEKGYFPSTKQLDGTYELVVRSPGFTPLRRTVQASISIDKGRPATLGIQLGIAGTCSLVTVASPLPERQ